MTAKRRPYRPNEDFLRVRDLLVGARRSGELPRTWDLCRWNYARHFVAPLRAGSEGIRFWEEAVSVWEDDEGDIVGVVHTEEPRAGEAWLQRRPGWDSILDEMVVHAERALADPGSRRLTVHVHDHDDSLLGVVRGRGYERGPEVTLCESELPVASATEPELPEGHAIRSMAEAPDLEARRRVLGLSFGHTDPAGWATVATYEELQRAPDYRPELDLFVTGPDGDSLSCCVVWFDERNRRATLEPVGTRPEQRKAGLGRAVVMEGVRRVAALGAERVSVGTDLPFYQAIGFRRTCTCHAWSR